MEAGFGPSLNLKDCSWPYMLLMRLGMHMLELLVKAVKVPRNILNPRLEPKLIPVLYHIYSFHSSWQVSLVLGALGLCRSPLHQNQALARSVSLPAAFPAQGCLEEPLVLCGWCQYLARLPDHTLFHSSPNPLLLTFISLVLLSRLG